MGMPAVRAADLIDISDVEAASSRLCGHISRTPFTHSKTLSDIASADIWLKFENLQFTGSFKQRGALNKLLQLSMAERSRGVMAVSAGNHAQGVAYHAAQLSIPATIIMPVGTPSVKAMRTRALGAKVDLIGRDFAEASAALMPLLEGSGATLIHPFDDNAVIAGQGTVALEMLEDHPDLDTVIASIGGGGLAAGMATVLKHRRPDITFIGVQSERFPGMAVALGRYDGAIAGGPTIAEGIAVSAPGQRTSAHAAAYVDDIVIVDENSIERAIALLLQVEKTLVEGAGAAGLAAVLAHAERFRGQRIGLVLSGGNIDNRLLTSILRRQQMREGQLFRLMVLLPDAQGKLGELCAAIGAMGGNINTVSHDRAFLAADAKSARVEVEVELADADVRQIMERDLASRGFIIEHQASHCASG